ncbi:MAG TPA: hypothetical protein VFJ18_04465, partial [Pararhizobium sp.]|nr:hypothetical protein [Pararhizobium sp.]
MAGFFRALVVVVSILGAAAAIGGAPMAAYAASAAPATTGSDAAPTQDSQIQTLIDALKNDKTRAKLVEALEKANAAGVPPASASPTPSEGVASFGRQIAEFTQSAAQDGARSVVRFVDQLTAAPRRLSALGPDQIDLFATAVRDVVLSIIATYFIYFVLRRLAIRLYRRIGVHAKKSGFLRTVFLIVFSVIVDACVVVAAWAAGYLITLTVFGQFGSVGIRQSL